ncbi:glycosyltransferase family protein [Ideonella sp. A 288]|uniref:glycosyltransferase family protein n=1 Tax=Ideonella sp. A 288 TaxID=1962181 RepID=UPI000B4A9E13|nr:glycosyltransferase [Ideonella sp. A 288]
MAEAPPKRILYYCQSLLGVGHLACSLRIIEELLPHAEVDLVYGGIDTASMVEHPRFRALRLPTLLHDAATGGFVDPEREDADGDHGEVWDARAAAIAGFVRHPYDAIVVEFYPFGRRRFKREIGDLFKAVKAHSGPVPIFCSVREVLVPRAVEKERRMVEGVRKHIHTVFVRGDPEIIRFDETFSLAPEIADRLCYTGYISPPPPPAGERPPRRRQVLVSVGGGNVGRELLEAAIGAAALMPDLHFLLAAGSRATPEEIGSLRARATSANVEIRPFLAQFQQHLMASAVSISMGGDNTLLEVITARTPALAYPYQGTPEQGIRIRKFAEKGLLHELGADDLAPERLKHKIEQALAAPYPAREVAVGGAKATSDRIMAVLGGAA